MKKLLLIFIIGCFFVAARAQYFLGNWRVEKMTIEPDSNFLHLDTAVQNIMHKYANQTKKIAHFSFSTAALRVHTFDSTNLSVYDDTIRYRWNARKDGKDSLLLFNDSSSPKNALRPDGMFLYMQNGYLIMQPFLPTYMRIWLRRED